MMTACLMTSPSLSLGLMTFWWGSCLESAWRLCTLGRHSLVRCSRGFWCFWVRCPSCYLLDGYRGVGSLSGETCIESRGSCSRLASLPGWWCVSEGVSGGGDESTALLFRWGCGTCYGEVKAELELFYHAKLERKRQALSTKVIMTPEGG